MGFQQVGEFIAVELIGDIADAVSPVAFENFLHLFLAGEDIGGIGQFEVSDGGVLSLNQCGCLIGAHLESIGIYLAEFPESHLIYIEPELTLVGVGKVFTESVNHSSEVIQRRDPVRLRPAFQGPDQFLPVYGHIFIFLIILFK